VEKNIYNSRLSKNQIKIIEGIYGLEGEIDGTIDEIIKNKTL
jgi:hypothetical protein